MYAVMNMLFYFTNFALLLFCPLIFPFCPLRSIFIRFFLPLGQPSFNIFQKFPWIPKEGLNALLLRYDTCMYAKK